MSRGLIMAKGLPKSIIKKYGITKKAWQVYRGKKTSRSRQTSTKRRVNKTPRRRYTKKRSRGKRNIRLPFAVIAGFSTPFVTAAPSGQSVVQSVISGNWQTALEDMRTMFTGFDTSGNFNPGYLKQTYLPMVIGVVVHKTIGKWINRMLAAANIPFIGV